MIAVTGATGFVGRALCRHLAEARQPFRALGRRAAAGVVAVGDIGPDTDWRAPLAGADTVIHLAARVHQMRDGGRDTLPLYRETNVEGTRTLARQAASAGVRRLVYASSVKVNGERTRPGRPFRPDDAPAPDDPYGRSKLEAEQALAAVAAETGLEVVVVRPPLVYGAGVGANFKALVALVRRGLPLPLGAVRNSRSLIAAENLADLLLHCATHPDAPGSTLLCSDDQDVSTPALLRAVGAAERRPVRLFSAPPWALRAAGRLAGQGAAVDRLTESLQVDISETRARLGWRPPFTLREAMFRAAASGWAAPPLSHSSSVRIE